MHPKIQFAILTPNTLIGLGLKSIIERIVPMVEIEIFGDQPTFADSTPERFSHYFVTAQSYIANAPFFNSQRAKTIILTDGNHQREFGQIFQINIMGTEQEIVRDLMRLHHRAHGDQHTKQHGGKQSLAQLSTREIEVLKLIVKGQINKEIANSLHISTTTVISHRRNICEKLNIRSVSGLTIFAITAGYIDPNEI